MNHQELRPQSLRLKPLSADSGFLSLSNQRRNFADRLFSRYTVPEKEKLQGLPASPKDIKKLTVPGILRNQNKPTTPSAEPSEQEDPNLSKKPAPIRKVAFREYTESGPGPPWRPSLHRHLAVQLDDWDISDDDDDDDDDKNNDDGFVFLMNENHPRKITHLKDCYRDAPRSLVSDRPILPDEGFTYLPSFHSHREAVTYHFFSSDEEEEGEDDDEDLYDEEKADVFDIEEDRSVCHHPECFQNATNGKSLLLCKECDTNIHSQPGFSGHLVLDLPPSARNDSGKKVPAKTDTEDASDLEEVSSEYNIQGEIQEEILEEDRVDGLKMVKSYSSVGNYGVEKRLKRKDAVKRKPSISNVKSGGYVSEFISDSGDRTRSKSLSAMEIQMGAAQLQFPPSQFVERTIPEAGLRHLSLPGTSGNGFLQVFIESMDESIKIAALKGKSIQELLSPQLEHLNIDISLVNIYLESSNTPLPLNSDAGYLEGTNLFIKAKDGIPDISPTGLTTKEREKKVQSVLNAKTRRASNLSVDDSSVTVKGGRPLFITNKQKMLSVETFC